MNLSGPTPPLPDGSPRRGRQRMDVTLELPRLAGALVRWAESFYLLAVTPKGDLLSGAQVRRGYRRTVLSIDILIVATFFATLPIAHVPIELWPAATLAVLVAATIAAGSLLAAPAGSAWAIASAVMNSGVVLLLDSLIGDYYHDQAYLFALLVAAHVIIQGWLPGLIVALMGAVAASASGPEPSRVSDAVFVFVCLASLAVIFTMRLRVQANAEARARESEARYKATLDAMPDAALIVDRGLKLLYGNPALARHAGLPVAQLAGLAVNAVLPALLAPAPSEAVAACLTGGPPRSLVVAQLGPLGVTAWFDLLFEPVPAGVFIRSRDVTAQHQARADAVTEAHIGAALSDVPARLSTGASIEEVGEAIAASLVEIEGIDIGVVAIFSGPEARVIGVAAGVACPLRAGWTLPSDDAQELRRRLSEGAWAADSTRPSDSGGRRLIADITGLQGHAVVPIRSGRDVVGTVIIGTTDPDLARALVDRQPGLVTLEAATSALLAERVAAARRADVARAVILAAVRDHAFHAVFAPTVDLQSGRIVGYDSRTVFHSGHRSRPMFEDAWRLGVGLDLSLEALRQLAVSSRRLPAGRWLEVKIHPRLLAESSALASILAEANRPIIAELTEGADAGHAASLPALLHDLGPDVRLAIRHAGVTLASFHRIAALKPRFVTVADDLVQGIHLDLGRQALATGLVRYSYSTGCRIIAEGVDDEREVATLRELGVDFARGDALGLPASADELALDPAGPQDGQPPGRLPPRRRPRRGPVPGRRIDGAAG